MILRYIMMFLLSFTRVEWSISETLTIDICKIIYSYPLNTAAITEKPIQKAPRQICCAVLDGKIDQMINVTAVVFDRMFCCGVL